jgi:hypothetical protein
MNVRLHKKGRKVTTNRPDDKGEFARIWLPHESNCAKSFVTREGEERLSEGYVVPKVGLPWPEWIK